MKIAMGQLLIEGGEPKRNFQRAEELVIEAKLQKSDLILLPECMDFGWTHPSGLIEAQSIPGEYTDILIGMAKKNKIYICAGLTEKNKFNGKNFNSAVLIDDCGNLIDLYRKINILEEAFDFYEIGQKLSVIDTKFGKIGINICSDNYNDSLEIGIVLAKMGAQIILSPSSWTVDHTISENDDPYHDKWQKPLKLLSKLFNISVVATTSVGYIVGGPFEGKKMVGCSLAFHAGKKISEGNYNEFSSDIKFIEINIEKNNLKGTQIGKMLKKKYYL